VERLLLKYKEKITRNRLVTTGIPRKKKKEKNLFQHKLEGFGVILLIEI